VSEPESDRAGQARHALQRVVAVARQGQARLNAYRQETVALGTWLREHLFRQGNRARQTRAGRFSRNAVTARRLRQRQEAHRNGGGQFSTTAAYALQRATRAASQRKNH
jgi:hypothetical protein